MRTSRRLTTVWLALLAVTLGSFTLGVEQSAHLAPVATIVILAAALFKARLIGIHFMELRSAPWGLRALFEVYVVVVFVALILLSGVGR